MACTMSRRMGGIGVAGARRASPSTSLGFRLSALGSTSPPSRRQRSRETLRAGKSRAARLRGAGAGSLPLPSELESRGESAHRGDAGLEQLPAGGGHAIVALAASAAMRRRLAHLRGDEAFVLEPD